RLVMDAAKVKATTGSRQVPSSTVFSVTQSSRKPNSSARRATVAIVVSVNGSGERCGNDMPRAVLSRNVMGFLVRFFPSACSGLYELPGSRLPEQLAWQAEKCARVVETLERRVVDHENHASPPPHNHEPRLADLLRRRLARSPGPGQARARSAAGVWASRGVGDRTGAGHPTACPTRAEKGTIAAPALTYLARNSRAMRMESPEVEMKIRTSVTASIERRNMRVNGPCHLRFFSA